MFKGHVLRVHKTFALNALMDTIVMEDWLQQLNNFNRKLLKSKKFWTIVILTKPIKYLIFGVILYKFFN